MILEELRVRALHIGNVTEDYEAEIEEYHAEAGVAVFAWKQKGNEELGLWIELAKDGSLIRLSNDFIRTDEKNSILSEEQLKIKALGFVQHHYPQAVKHFSFEEWKKNGDGNFKLSYVQTELDLPLPFTGFNLSIAESGEITHFCYDGKAENIYLPDKIVDKETIKEKFLDDLALELLITEISNELYIDGDNQLHLVYEPSLPFYSIPVDGKTELSKAEEEEDPCEYVEPISRPKGDLKHINDLIGFDEHVFEKIRELDLGNVTGSVWRIQGVNEEYQNDLSMDGYFHRRNDGTLKMMHDNKTGNLKGVYSFIERKGDLQLDDLSCKEIALQFLFSLYSTAEEYFSLAMIEEDHDEERTHFHYEFRVFYERIPIRFSSARISVNKTTGTIDHYMSPEIAPEALMNIQTQPVITEAKAKAIYRGEFCVETEWRQNYIDNQETYYTLTYVPSFPALKGDLAFIEACTGHKIMKEF